MKRIFPFFFGILVLLGAGCATADTVVYNNDAVSVNDANTDASQPLYIPLSCDDGMQLFQGTRHNIEFCYPEYSGSEDALVTVREETDGIILSVRGEDMRKVWVLNEDAITSHADLVQRYAVENPENVTCGVMSAYDEVEGRSAYVVVGESPDGEQNIDSVTACTYLVSDATGDFDMNMQRSGIFYFFDRVPGLMYILTSEQDMSLGTQTQAFVSSLQPKE
jgi:hypothetical protein